jgi:hypothetical protein
LGDFFTNSSDHPSLLSDTLLPFFLFSLENDHCAPLTTAITQIQKTFFLFKLPSKPTRTKGKQFYSEFRSFFQTDPCDSFSRKPDHSQEWHFTSERKRTRARAARFYMVQITYQNGKNVPNDHKPIPYDL